ncbi:MAG: hypothetical protein HY895_00360 [Deltaproteobacteria bacterium]|nr:hypothetical protein [Deltaproteobacteria bacterium]
MIILDRHSLGARLITALLLMWLFVTGCSGITPYQPRNNREEGPEKGVFTGSKGEFVILVPDEPAKEEGTAKKTSEKTPKSE